MTSSNEEPGNYFKNSQIISIMLSAIRDTRCTVFGPEDGSLAGAVGVTGG
jgi:hypothetical protein